MISVCIPTYNYPIFPLVKEIHKQLSLCDIPWEIIVCNDASTSYTEENEKAASFSNCTYINMPANVGRTAVRNTLAERAVFDWLLFLDADVLPKHENFIGTYIQALTTSQTVIYGGTSYAAQKPKHAELRWTYGNAREVKTTKERTGSYDIISQNLCVKKDVFLKCNTFTENSYGLDIIFSQALERHKASVLHIHNPVVHLGLEANAVFLEKSLAAIETTYVFEKKDIVRKDFRPVQRTYLTLKKWRLENTVAQLVSFCETAIKKNLLSSTPSMRLFDLYKLSYYTKLKQNTDA